MAEKRRKNQGGYKSLLLFFTLQCNLEKPWGSLNYAQLSIALRGMSCFWKVAPLSPGAYQEQTRRLVAHNDLGKRRKHYIRFVCVCVHAL